VTTIAARLSFGHWFRVRQLPAPLALPGDVGGGGAGRMRLAELVAALSLGVDLGFGQPAAEVVRESPRRSSTDRPRHRVRWIPQSRDPGRGAWCAGKTSLVCPHVP
jgi:hypothetical protein